MWKRRTSRRRLHARLVDGLDGLRAGLDAERRLPADQRTSTASNASVLDAVDRVEAVWRRLSWGDAVAGGLELRALAAITRDWAPGSALTGQVRDVVQVAEELLGRYAEDPRLAPSPPAPTELHPRDPRLEPQPPATSEFLLPDAQSLPAVVELLRNGDTMGAIKGYRAETGVGLRDAQAAVDWAARRMGLPESGR